jgi:prepilin-type N-terminal cleavage/methylation domain-containing protein
MSSIKKNGFTLIELIVTIMLFSFFVFSAGLIYKYLVSGFSVHREITNTGVKQEVLKGVIVRHTPLFSVMSIYETNLDGANCVIFPHKRGVALSAQSHNGSVFFGSSTLLPDDILINQLTGTEINLSSALFVDEGAFLSESIDPNAHNAEWDIMLSTQSALCVQDNRLYWRSSTNSITSLSDLDILLESNTPINLELSSVGTSKSMSIVSGWGGVFWFN